MVCDILKNKDLYSGLGDRLKKALAFIEKNDDGNLPVGRYEFEGDDMYAMVQQYKTENKENRRFEAHRKYIDVQFILSGSETVYWDNINKLRTSALYDGERDCSYYEGHDGSPVILESGSFMILFPDDAHKPCCIYEQVEKVTKIVVKVKV